MLSRSFLIAQSDALGVEPVDHHGGNVVARRAVQAHHLHALRERRRASDQEAAVDRDGEAGDAHGSYERRLRQDAVLPEELPVPKVMNIRVGDAPLAARRRDKIALPVAATQEHVTRHRARRHVLVHRTLGARELGPDLSGRKREGAAQGAYRLGGARDGRQYQLLALERAQAQRGGYLVRGRRQPQAQNGVILERQDGHEQQSACKAVLLQDDPARGVAELLDTPQQRPSAEHRADEPDRPAIRAERPPAVRAGRPGVLEEQPAPVLLRHGSSRKAGEERIDVLERLWTHALHFNRHAAISARLALCFEIYETKQPVVWSITVVLPSVERWCVPTIPLRKFDLISVTSSSA